MHEMDLSTGAREFQDLEEEEEDEDEGYSSMTFKEKAIYQLKNW
jgi:amino acid transporter